eukprot:gnl/TRDRNA2_/TRDRNA2_178075_c0_seq1.p1 gnl/TRDRNA2_/TRDRNA2_178075_c0~~gnl/TRDRNA2_/TRDRNA2_178075_c0_seq1.p1  ORF type:complete len:843 (+),score=223.50 gnl/TRDRNA2_/TRDRNA2_178075_c0_seq1:74-2602(+)
MATGGDTKSRRKDVSDVTKGEKTPLIEKKKSSKERFKSKEKQMIEDMDDVGAVDTNPAFKQACIFTVRTAFYAMLLGCTVWVPIVRKLFPDTLAGYMGLAALLFLFTVNRVLGCTIGNSLVGIFGTWIACTHMWVMQGIFPGGVGPEDSPTSTVALFGWANFIGFQTLVLCSQCSMGMKMFANSYNVGFMMDFLNPNSTTPYSTNFKIKSSGVAVNCMMATCIACTLAILNNLFPWVQDTAFSAMAAGAKDSAKDMGALLKVAVKYYSGSKPSIVIHAATKKSRDLSAQLGTLGGAIGGCYYEGFDMGVKGTIRKLTESHAGLLGSLMDRVKAILIALSTEDFAESHTKIMEGIAEPAANVADAVDALLMATTEAMSDGDIDESEKANLRMLVKDAKDAVAELAEAFDTVRKTFDASVHPELLGESFFVLTLSAYVRLVYEFTETLVNDPPKGGGNLGGDLVNCIKSTWDTTAMFDKFNLNFTIRYVLAVVTGFCMSKYYFGHVGTCAVLCTLLINKRVGPDMRATLNVILAVVVGSLTGAIVYEHSCASPYGNIILPLCFFTFLLLTLYPYFSGSVYAGVGLTMAALGAPRFVALCMDLDKVAMAKGMWGTLVAVVFAIAIIVFYESICAIDRASSLAKDGLEKGFNDLQAAFKAFWAEEDISTAIAPVAGQMDQCVSFNTTADIEPRFWREDWKKTLYDDIVDQVRALRLDLLMLESAMEGASGSAGGLFDKIAGCDSWSKIQADLNTTLAQAAKVSVALIGHESGKCTALSGIDATDNIDELDDLPELLKDLADLVKLPETAPATMEEDEICRISAVLIMLSQTCAHTAQIIKMCLQNA